MLEEVNKTETSKRGTEKTEVENLNLDNDDDENDEDALLAKTTDDEDEFSQVSAFKTTEDSNQADLSCDLDDDDEDLFREIDAFLWNNGAEKRLENISKTKIPCAIFMKLALEFL